MILNGIWIPILRVVACDLVDVVLIVRIQTGIWKILPRITEDLCRMMLMVFVVVVVVVVLIRSHGMT